MSARAIGCAAARGDPRRHTRSVLWRPDEGSSPHRFDPRATPGAGAHATSAPGRCRSRARTLLRPDPRSHARVTAAVRFAPAPGLPPDRGRTPRRSVRVSPRSISGSSRSRGRRHRPHSPGSPARSIGCSASSPPTRSRGPLPQARRRGRPGLKYFAALSWCAGGLTNMKLMCSKIHNSWDGTPPETAFCRLRHAKVRAFSCEDSPTRA